MKGEIGGLRLTSGPATTARDVSWYGDDMMEREKEL